MQNNDLNFCRPPETLIDSVAPREEATSENEIRTRDPNLGKVVLYQLSYSRMM